MSQLTAVDISDSDRFELAEVLKEESESSSAPRPLEDILQETCDDDFERAVTAKCPIEMGGYDSLEQLQQVWDTRCPNDSAPMTYKDANDADA